jgi:hypothetical protein
VAINVLTKPTRRPPSSDGILVGKKEEEAAQRPKVELYFANAVSRVLVEMLNSF